VEGGERGKQADLDLAGNACRFGLLKAALTAAGVD
jgi:hypothetical protein